MRDAAEKKMSWSGGDRKGDGGRGDPGPLRIKFAPEGTEAALPAPARVADDSGAMVVGETVVRLGERLGWTAGAGFTRAEAAQLAGEIQARLTTSRPVAARFEDRKLVFYFAA